MYILRLNAASEIIRGQKWPRCLKSEKKSHSTYDYILSEVH